MIEIFFIQRIAFPSPERSSHGSQMIEILIYEHVSIVFWTGKYHTKLLCYKKKIRSRNFEKLLCHCGRHVHRKAFSGFYVIFMFPIMRRLQNRCTAFCRYTNLLRTLINGFWALWRKSKNFMRSNFFTQKLKILKFHEKNDLFSKVSLSLSPQPQQKKFRALHRSRNKLHIYTSWRLSGISSFPPMCENLVQYFSTISQEEIHLLNLVRSSFFHRGLSGWLHIEWTVREASLHCNYAFQTIFSRFKKWVIFDFLSLEKDFSKYSVFCCLFGKK